MTDSVTVARQQFESHLAAWAIENGYKRRNYLWQHPCGTHLTIRREYAGKQIRFVAEKRLLGGRAVGDVAI